MYQNVVVNSDPHLSSANVCYSKISKVVQIRLNRALRRHLSSSQFEEIAGQLLAPPSLPPSLLDDRAPRRMLGRNGQFLPSRHFTDILGRTGVRVNEAYCRPRPCLHYFAAVTHSVRLRYPRVTDS